MLTAEDLTQSSIALDRRLTRRAAIAGISAFGVAGMTMLGAGPTSAFTKATKQLHEMGIADWQRLVGQPFRLIGAADYEITPASPRIALRLREAVDRTVAGDVHRPSHLRRSAISLLFSAPDSVQLPNLTYTLEHSELGRFPLFLHARSKGACASASEQLFESILN